MTGNIKQRPIDSLAGKKILFVAPSFFGYAAEIERELKAAGATVFRYENRPVTGFLGKVLVRLFPAGLRPVTKRYYEAILSNHQNDAIDLIFVLRGEGIDRSIVARFRKFYPNARCVLYLWDSFRNDKGADDRVNHFDTASTFDLQDARVAGIRFVPLFYLRDYSAQRSVAADIDISFIGTVHTDRYAVLRRLLATVDREASRFLFLYFPSKVIYWARAIGSPSFWGAKQSEFSFVPLSRDELLALVGRSRVMVDIERPVQTGLTMRTLEALGAQRKLVTTNASVAQYDFFDARNIAVIDRNKPSLPSDFLASGFVATAPDILAKYEVGYWLEVVLGLSDCPGYLRQ